MRRALVVLLRGDFPEAVHLGWIDRLAVSGHHQYLGATRQQLNVVVT